jgi:xanthosine utilization system XapX-like protein
MLAGMLVGISAYWMIRQRVHPEPSYIVAVPILCMLVGVAIGELVKRWRARNT